MSNIPIDTEDIEVPPFPFSEEEEKKTSDPVDPVKKRGKGVNQTDLVINCVYLQDTKNRAP